MKGRAAPGNEQQGKASPSASWGGRKDQYERPPGAPEPRATAGGQGHWSLWAIPATGSGGSFLNNELCLLAWTPFFSWQNQLLSAFSVPCLPLRRVGRAPGPQTSRCSPVRLLNPVSVPACLPSPLPWTRGLPTQGSPSDHGPSSGTEQVAGPAWWGPAQPASRLPTGIHGARAGEDADLGLPAQPSLQSGATPSFTYLFIRSFIHSFNKPSLSTCHVPDTTLGTEDCAGKKSGQTRAASTSGHLLLLPASWAAGGHRLLRT